MTEANNSIKQIIMTANFESFESYNTSMDAMRCYAQNAGVEDLWEGTDVVITRIIEVENDPNNTVYDPVTGAFKRSENRDLHFRNQEYQNLAYERKMARREKRVKKLLTIMTNWLQGSTEKQLLKRLRIDDDEWMDVI